MQGNLFRLKLFFGGCLDFQIGVETTEWLLGEGFSLQLLTEACTSALPPSLFPARWLEVDGEVSPCFFPFTVVFNSTRRTSDRAALGPFAPVPSRRAVSLTLPARGDPAQAVSCRPGRRHGQGCHPPPSPQRHLLTLPGRRWQGRPRGSRGGRQGRAAPSEGRGLSPGPGPNPGRPRPAPTWEGPIKSSRSVSCSTPLKGDAMPAAPPPSAAARWKGRGCHTVVKGQTPHCRKGKRGAETRMCRAERRGERACAERSGRAVRRGGHDGGRGAGGRALRRQAACGAFVDL